MEGLGTWVALFLMILLGIPHGATDHILFRHINKDFGKGFFYRFLARYLLLMGLFLLVWWILPAMALLLFLAISAYHFGQSHWNELVLKQWQKYLLYTFWGGFLLTSLLLINHVETMPIVSSMIDLEISLSDQLAFVIITSFFVFTVSLLLYLHHSGLLTSSILIKEFLMLILLVWLFASQPLLVGFSVYFVLWHSTLSVADQIQYFKKHRPNYTLKDFLRQSIPFSLIAFCGLGALAYFSPYAPASEEWIGQFFILISVVTLPHSLLMDAILDKDNASDYVRKKDNAQHYSDKGILYHFLSMEHKEKKTKRYIN